MHSWLPVYLRMLQRHTLYCCHWNPSSFSFHKFYQSVSNRKRGVHISAFVLPNEHTHTVFWSLPLPSSACASPLKWSAYFHAGCRPIIWLMDKVKLKNFLYKWHFSLSWQNMFLTEQGKWPFSTKLSGDLYSVLGTWKHICHQEYNFLIGLSFSFPRTSEVALILSLLGNTLVLKEKRGTLIWNLAKPFQLPFPHHAIKENTEAVSQRMVWRALLVSQSVGWR